MAKRNHLLVRFTNSKYTFYRNNRRATNISNEQKNKEIEYCFMIHNIEQYGFNFFPDHYVREEVKSLEKFVK